MATIAGTATLIIQAIEEGKEIYQTAVNAMDALETVSANKSGADKKDIVLAVIQSFVEEAGQNWSTWADLVSKFIDTIKGLYNDALDLIHSFKSNPASV